MTQCKGCSKQLTTGGRKAATGFCKRCFTLSRNGGDTRPFIVLYKSVKRAAEARSHHFDLTYEQFMWFIENIGMCRYCGEQVFWTDRRGAKYNLDCKDPKKGYTFDNLCVCCSTCNYRKGNHFSDAEFAAVADFFRVWQRLTPNDKKELELSVSSFQQGYIPNNEGRTDRG